MFGDICLPGEVVTALVTAGVGAIATLYARLNKVTDSQIERLKRYDEAAQSAALEEARNGRRQQT